MSSLVPYKVFFTSCCRCRWAAILFLFFLLVSFEMPFSTNKRTECAAKRQRAKDGNENYYDFSRTHFKLDRATSTNRKITFQSSKQKLQISKHFEFQNVRKKLCGHPMTTKVNKWKRRIWSRRRRSLIYAWIRCSQYMHLYLYTRCMPFHLLGLMKHFEAFRHSVYGKELNNNSRATTIMKREEIKINFPYRIKSIL